MKHRWTFGWKMKSTNGFVNFARNVLIVLREHREEERGEEKRREEKGKEEKRRGEKRKAEKRREVKRREKEKETVKMRSELTQLKKEC